MSNRLHQAQSRSRKSRVDSSTFRLFFRVRYRPRREPSEFQMWKLVHRVWLSLNNLVGRVFFLSFYPKKELIWYKKVNAMFLGLLNRIFKMLFFLTVDLFFRFTYIFWRNIIQSIYNPSDSSFLWLLQYTYSEVRDTIYQRSASSFEVVSLSCHNIYIYAYILRMDWNKKSIKRNELINITFTVNLVFIPELILC